MYAPAATAAAPSRHLMVRASDGDRVRTARASLPQMPMPYVATAGWSIPREAADHAPAGATGLQRYASVLNATEINSTFYRRHQLKTFERWRDSVPDQFRFAVKLPRSITHEAALARPQDRLREFFEDVAGLGEKLGPILVQTPASLDFDLPRARAFFQALRARYSGSVACEPRHPAWYGAQASALLTEHQIARVVADPPRPADAALPGGSARLRYVRWHGSPQVYRSSYSEEQLVALANYVAAASKNCDVWCVFDNTASGAALCNARRFTRILAEKSIC